MKQIKTCKLGIRVETIRQLQPGELEKVAGGLSYSCNPISKSQRCNTGQTTA
jgi:hypothetical protein